MIEARGLTKRFGDVEAVIGLDLSVEPGSVLGLLGPNGAGKTTTVQMLTTLVSIDGGTASVGGHDVADEPMQVRQLIGLAGQSAAVDEKLTARENLYLFGRLYKIARAPLARRIDELIDRFRMGAFADRRAETYSGGERRRLDVVAALVASPPALFLDEPTTGLDPRSRSELWDAVSGLAADGTAIVLTTQYLEEADRLADHIVMLDNGCEVASGTPATLKRDLRRDVFEIHLDASGDVDRAAALIGLRDDVTVDAERRLVRVAVGDGARESLDVLRRLDEAGVEPSDFQLRRPTLDDVFLALTRPERGQP